MATNKKNRATLTKCVRAGVMTYDEAQEIEKSFKKSKYRVATATKTKEMAKTMQDMWALIDSEEEVDKKLLKRQLINIETMYITKPDLSNPESVNDCCKKYFKLCAEKNSHWTFAGLLLALGIGKNEFMKILNGEKLRSVQPVLQEAYQLLNASLETEAMSGKVNPMIIAYLGNNNFGYADKKEVKVVTNKTEDLSDEELQQKYIDVEVD